MGQLFLKPCCGKAFGLNWPVLGYVSSCMSLPFYKGWILIVELSGKTEKPKFQHHRIHSRSFHIDLVLTLIRSGSPSHSTAFPSLVYSFKKEPVSFTVVWHYLILPNPTSLAYAATFHFKLCSYTATPAYFYGTTVDSAVVGYFS